MWNEAGAVRRRSCVVLRKEYALFSSPSLSKKERRVFFLCSKVEFLSNRARPEPFAEKSACDTAGFPSLATPLYIKASPMPTRPRREKRIHRQHDEQCCRWILFCGSAKRASGVREKRGGKRAGGGASRAPHRREGTESGEVWNEKVRRCVTKRAENRKGTRRIEKAHGI